jgi:hypothetical protein
VHPSYACTVHVHYVLLYLAVLSPRIVATRVSRKIMAEQRRITCFFASSSEASSSASVNVSETDSLLDESEPEQPPKRPPVVTVASWSKKHVWLTYNEESGMFCKLCSKYNMMPRNGTGKWVTA